jgi:hypothetical protein
MDKQDLFNIWAPATSIWSPWVKPVLFAHYPMPFPELSEPSLPDLSEIPSGSGGAVQERWALVIDLPGPQSVFVGLALAQMGYRPVPLFNACPPPANYPPPSRLAVVDMDSILAALVQGKSGSGPHPWRMTLRLLFWSTPTGKRYSDPSTWATLTTGLLFSQPISLQPISWPGITFTGRFCCPGHNHRRGIFNMCCTLGKKLVPR